MHTYEHMYMKTSIHKRIYRYVYVHLFIGSFIHTMHLNDIWTVQLSSLQLSMFPQLALNDSLYGCFQFPIRSGT